MPFDYEIPGKSLAEAIRHRVRERWPSAATFYRDRDHRTALEVMDLDCYTERPVEIHVDPALGAEVDIQRVAVMATNLTARWARCVRVFVPDVVLVSPLVRDGCSTLANRIEREMILADPFGRFEVVVHDTPSKSRQYVETDVVRLFIGPWRDGFGKVQVADSDYVVTASGWVVVGRRAANDPIASVPPQSAAASATALAAALGVADLFKRAIGHPTSEWLPQFTWCTWKNELRHGTSDHGDVASFDAPIIEKSFNVGRVLLAGGGAIGSAMIYIADLGQVVADWTILDQDVVDVTNLNRCPPFTILDAFYNADKPGVLTRYLRGTGTSVVPICGTWHEHAGWLGEKEFDVWVSLTNEHGAWAEVPFQLPPVVVHGTTTSGWGVSAGRHIPRTEDCTMCRMPRPEAEFRGPCAEGEVLQSVSGQPTRASLPFLSTAAAALAVGELAKLRYAETRYLPNDVAVDLRFGLPTVLGLRRQSRAECRGCRAAWSGLWEQRGGRGRYAALTSGGD